ncbi:hypothetical protein HK097_001201 [Rhizophlyctis rosea]|uniref:Uncharacterized protein n=1 Tax=Rhizophlyctis rosea TaxID=64517 RepID=A0AAD5SHH5_9FUNG|nr:hypothetical protein HK097_001201 [Rhizophlyctis rosea]
MANPIRLTPTLLNSHLTKIFTPKPKIPNADWVAFTHGTFYISSSSDFTTLPALLSNAKSSLSQYAGEMVAGTSGADFTAIPQEKYFPDDSVWAITYDAPAVMTLVVLDEKGYDTHGPKSLRAGLEGRMCRNMDAQELKVVATSRDE